MAREDWVVGGDRHTAAAERVYAVAEDIVRRDGLDALDIDTLAARVHCSRATIYRYAGGKAQIRDAVLLRMAAGVVETVRSAVAGLSGPERIFRAITVALEEMRSDPVRRLMAGAGMARELSNLRSSPVLNRTAAELAGLTDDDPEAARWIVHVVLSLFYFPLGDERTERDMLRRFISPAFS